MPTKYKILRNIPEVFEAVANSYEAACDMIGEGQVEDSVALDDRYELVEEQEITEEDWVREVLEARGLPYKPCGLNADWAVSAWHLSKGAPNVTDGDLYLLDTEEIDDLGEYSYEVVNRTYTANDPEGDGNDTVVKIAGPGPLVRTIDQWRALRGLGDALEGRLNDGDTARDGEQQGV